MIGITTVILSNFAWKATEIMLVGTVKNKNVFIADKPQKCRPLVPTVVEKQLRDFFDHTSGIADVFQHGIRKSAINALNEGSYHNASIISLCKNFHLIVGNTISIKINHVVIINGQLPKVSLIIANIQGTSFGYHINTNMLNANP